MFLLEYLQNNMYRVQNITTFFEVVEKNRIRTSVAGYKEKNHNRNKLYYVSFARNVHSDYIDDMCDDDVLIVFDGLKLNNNFRSVPVKYFESELNEAEERIITNKEYLENALSYIKEVHISLAYNSYSQDFYNKLLKMHDKLIKNGINLWYYKNTNDCKILNIKSATKRPDVNVRANASYKEWLNPDDYERKLDIFLDGSYYITLSDVLKSLTKMVKKHIFNEDIEYDFVMLLLKKIIKNNMQGSISYISNYFEDAIPHYDAYRPELTELLKLLKRSNTDFNLEKIFKKIRESINNG